jgi:hypothetical protein
MIYSYSTSDQTVAVNATILFDDNGVVSGRCSTHSAGTGAFSLNGPGYYLVHFHGDVSAAAAGDVVAQLYVNGELYEGAEATTTITTANTEIDNIGFQVLVKVMPNCCAVDTNVPTTLTFRNIGVEATYSNLGVTIVKIR